MNTFEMVVSATGGLSCFVAAAGMAVRAHLLGSRVSGWPSAPKPLRVALWSAAAVMGGQGLSILSWMSHVDRGECLVYLATAVLSVFYAVNLVLQRSEDHAAPAAREPLKLHAVEVRSRQA